MVTRGHITTSPPKVPRAALHRFARFVRDGAPGAARGAEDADSPICPLRLTAGQAAVPPREPRTEPSR